MYIPATDIKLTVNPYNPDYVINGCPVHSRTERWAHKEMFYREDNFFVCERCEEGYSPEQVQAVLFRDEIKVDMDVINWAHKYAWAGEYPDNGGFAIPCPKCGNERTGYGTIINTTCNGQPHMSRHKCFKCGTIFDSKDLPDFWGRTNPQGHFISDLWVEAGCTECHRNGLVAATEVELIENEETGLTDYVCACGNIYSSESF